MRQCETSSSSTGTRSWPRLRQVMHSARETVFQGAVVEPHPMYSGREKETRGAVGESYLKHSSQRPVVSGVVRGPTVDESDSHRSWGGCCTDLTGVDPTRNLVVQDRLTETFAPSYHLPDEGLKQHYAPRFYLQGTHKRWGSLPVSPGRKMLLQRKLICIRRYDTPWCSISYMSVYQIPHLFKGDVESPQLNGTHRWKATRLL